MRLIFLILLFLSSVCIAQNIDTLPKKPDTTELKAFHPHLSITTDTNSRPKVSANKVLSETEVHGQVKDKTGNPLPFVTVQFRGSTFKSATDSNGRYSISGHGSYSQVEFHLIGFKILVKSCMPMKSQKMDATIVSDQKQLNEVVVTGSRRKKYHNKDNPAVSLIQQIINHKKFNQPQSRDYLQYQQYERIEFSLIDLSTKFLTSKFFKKYRFLLDSSLIINGKNQTALPVYLSEKQSSNYFRKDPAKSISILDAHKEVNFSAFIDSAGLDLYLNRLYKTVDIYANNIFIITNEFLSPISDNSPSFYKYFITDTVLIKGKKILEVTFLPRNRGDLLFEGKLYVTMDGNFSVQSVDMEVDKQINLNFLRSFHLNQEFEQLPDKRYYLTKSKTSSDFGILKDKNVGLYGERTVFLSNYKLDQPMPFAFYSGESSQTATGASRQDTAYWNKNRTDTLSPSQTKVYSHIDSLQKMPSFKKTLWLTTLITGGYAITGPLQLGPLDAIYSYNTVEGNRVRVGGRTTPEFNKSIYLENYLAYGFRDKRFKYFQSIAFAFNDIAPYRYPNNYLIASYQYDTDIPGQNFLLEQNQSFLGSITRGSIDLWLYNQTFRLNYVRDFKPKIQINIGLKSQTQTTAGALTYVLSSPIPMVVNRLKTTELTLGLQYAPHEQLFQGTIHRHPIHNKYPILNLQLNYGIRGLFQSQYNYLNASANIFKRFYLSQLGSTDVTVQTGAVFGHVPFPLLVILPANQSYQYDPNAYNMMNFLEFVSDHYAGLNLTHSFGGFFLNKVPLIRKLNLREFLSFKILYGGLTDQNNPLFHSDLFHSPIHSDGTVSTFPLSRKPYIEAGIGLGNILKVLRLDVIRRFNYLDHPGVATYGLRFSINPDL